MLQYLVPLLLGLAHGVADGSVGMQLGHLPATQSLARVGILVLLYNVLAFGCQPIAGALTDRLRAPRGAVLAGLALHCAALLLCGRFPEVAVVLAGLGSAAFHVGGGALALCATRGRAIGPGLFAAPGVVGLAIGGALALAGSRPVAIFLLPLVACVAIVAVLRLPALPYAEREPEPIFEDHDLVMLVLLASIALRSVAWNALQFLFAGRLDLIVAMAVAAAVGKILGGYLADRLGWRRWTLGALSLAAPLLALGGDRPYALLPGVALLQSATPVALAATGRLLPRRPALAAGLALGLAIAAGGLPAVLDTGPALAKPPALAALTLVAAGGLWWSLRARQRHPAQEATASPVAPPAAPATEALRVS